MGAQQKLLRFILTNRHYEAVRPSTPAVSSGRGRRTLARLLSALPFARHFLNPKLLQPTTIADYGNLFLVRKLREDDRPRNGRHYIDF